jgi:hypothetical protein
VCTLLFDGDLELLPKPKLGADYLILSSCSKLYFPGPGTVLSTFENLRSWPNLVDAVSNIFHGASVLYYPGPGMVAVCARS